MNYLQDETLAFLRHEERLVEAANQRLANQIPQAHSRRLVTWVQRFSEQRRKWFVPRRSVIVKQAF
ncbi:MAG: hypothetical protein NT075_16590 [Chloroflexi bacterium]|nr:hypothetical protein [Chloroflexota bacterium]